MSNASFVPAGATSRWPFVLGGPGAARRPPWNARLLFWWGMVEAVAGIQPRRLREEYWRTMPRDALATFLRSDGLGVDHPSRNAAARLVQPGETVLDVGCGTGVNYEVLTPIGRLSHYVGVDSSEAAVQLAREFHPRGDFRVGTAHGLVRQFGEQSFDVILVRHVLEHLPDFEEAMGQALAVARRLVIFVFFLTPRDLPFGVRKINLRLNPRIYANVYSRQAIELWLSQRGLNWRWTWGVGPSRAGWFTGEVNTILEVLRRAARPPEDAHER